MRIVYSTKFFRLPREKAQTGAGLGLTIAKEIIEAHQGTIGFRPRHGGGSEFTFTVPAASVEKGMTVAVDSGRPQTGISAIRSNG